MTRNTKYNEQHKKTQEKYTFPEVQVGKTSQRNSYWLFKKVKNVQRYIPLASKQPEKDDATVFPTAKR